MFRAKGREDEYLDRASLCKFIKVRDLLNDRDYLTATIAFAAAPTLAGVKPAALLSFTGDGRDLKGLWERFKIDVSAGLSLEYFELIKDASRTLVLFYRGGVLERLLSDRKNASILADLGYETGMAPADSLQALRRRFAPACPPEIGVFLGIPVEDVRGFMEYKGKGCLLSGYWKVYHDPGRAERLFQAYDRARSAALAGLLGNTGFTNSDYKIYMKQ